MKNCIKCNTEMSDEMKFCPECGAPQPVEAEPEAPQEAPNANDFFSQPEAQQQEPVQQEEAQAQSIPQGAPRPNQVSGQQYGDYHYQNGSQQQAGPGPNQSYNNQQYASNPNDNGGFGWGLLGFCIPIVGLVLFLVWKDSQPNNGKAAGLGALISVGVGVLFYIVAFLIGITGAAMY